MVHSAESWIASAYLNKYFSTKRIIGRFNCLPSHQVIEQTVNKEQKGKGGIIGSCTSEDAIQMCILTSHILASLMTGLQKFISLQIYQRRGV